MIEPDLSYIHPQLQYLAVAIDTVRPDPANARVHGRKNKLAIAGSLETFQQRKPIVVRQRDGVIEAGNGTWEQARALGWTHIAAVVCDDDEVQAAAYAVADNRTGELAGWSKDNLAATLRKLQEQRVPLEKLGFTAEDVAKRLGAEAPVTTDPSEVLSKFNPEDRVLMEGMAGYRTALARTTPSLPMACYYGKGLLKGRVLDYGCGRDVYPPQVRVTRYDPAYFPSLEPLEARYDTITLNYVLNVIPLEAHRVQVLLTLRTLLRAGGRVLVAVYRKDDEDSTSNVGYQCGWSPEQWEGLFRRWYSAARLDGGFLGWVLTPVTLVGGVPGKVIGGARYFHRSALELQDESIRGAVRTAQSIAGAWAWDVACVDPTADTVALIKSDDWDTAPEPTVGPRAVVDLSKQTPPEVRDTLGFIYHHKWMFVADDYPGFDVGASKARSRAWEALSGVERSKIGRRDYWEREVLPRLTAAAVPAASGMFGGF